MAKNEVDGGATFLSVFLPGTLVEGYVGPYDVPGIG